MHFTFADCCLVHDYLPQMALITVRLPNGLRITRYEGKLFDAYASNAYDAY